MKKKFDLKIWQRNRKIFILGYGMSQVDQKRPPWINAKLKICHMKLQYQIGSICKSGVRAFITKRGKGWFMSKPLRINGVRHTLVEKWLLLSPWEYPRLLSNVPGSVFTSEVLNYVLYFVSLCATSIQRGKLFKLKGGNHWFFRHAWFE